MAEQSQRIGRTAMMLALTDHEEELMKNENLVWCVGKVGTMDAQKVVAAIETAAKQNGVINGALYREVHSLYHATLEAIQGVTRGHVQLGDVLRTVGLRFAVVRGKPYKNVNEGDWIAVALYGTIGAPIKGSEHESAGLGINHI
ncbi:hut operon transcriptional regulator HutP [Gottfriedia acidiceleris]|uniref:Hut operon positive regulatory protein n=1 Tax=Gottfriedia acidiceleris TaxID=371036 RepID=A0ABY4JHN4_9BACI|nr:hut operon transcriptional regulator HutP [Gottfriedia acidiceleris]UPM52599.1 hut operon transcriptional regulator HutP [Gottfriedia acidiceleris]